MSQNWNDKRLPLWPEREPDKGGQRKGGFPGTRKKSNRQGGAIPGDPLAFRFSHHSGPVAKQALPYHRPALVVERGGQAGNQAAPCCHAQKAQVRRNGSGGAPVGYSEA